MDDLSLTYSALAHPTRRGILRHIRSGSERVTDVAEDFDVSLNTVSKHIKQLEEAGLILREVQGREHLLSVEPTRLVRASTWIEDYCAFWERRVENLERVLHMKGSRER